MPNLSQQKVYRLVGYFQYLVYGVPSSVMMLPYLCRGWRERFQAGVGERYLTVVPAISSGLDDPPYGSNDTEDSCDPMAAIEDPYRLNDACGSGTRWIPVGNRVTWELPQIYLGIPRTLKIDQEGRG